MDLSPQKGSPNCCGNRNSPGNTNMLVALHSRKIAFKSDAYSAIEKFITYQVVQITPLRLDPTIPSAIK